MKTWEWEKKFFQIYNFIYWNSLVSNERQIQQGQGKAWHIPSPKNLTLWPWPLVKIHWKMLILECSQGCYAVKIGPLDLWPRKSIGFQTLLRTKYIPSLVKIHWMMLILVFTRMSHDKKLTRWPWPLTLTINRVPDSLKD